MRGGGGMTTCAHRNGVSLTLSSTMSPAASASCSRDASTEGCEHVVAQGWGGVEAPAAWRRRGRWRSLPGPAGGEGWKHLQRGAAVGAGGLCPSQHEAVGDAAVGEAARHLPDLVAPWLVAAAREIAEGDERLGAGEDHCDSF